MLNTFNTSQFPFWCDGNGSITFMCFTHLFLHHSWILQYIWSCRNPISPKGIYSFINGNPILTFITLNLPLTILLSIASPLLPAYFGGVATRRDECYIFIKRLTQIIHYGYIMMMMGGGGINKNKAIAEIYETISNN